MQSNDFTFKFSFYACRNNWALLYFWSFPVGNINQSLKSLPPKYDLYFLRAHMSLVATKFFFRNILLFLRRANSLQKLFTDKFISFPWKLQKFGKILPSETQLLVKSVKMSKNHTIRSSKSKMCEMCEMWKLVCILWGLLIYFSTIKSVGLISHGRDRYVFFFAQVWIVFLRFTYVCDLNFSILCCFWSFYVFASSCPTNTFQS